MEALITFMYLAVIAFAIFEILLAFKLWRMCDDVRQIMMKYVWYNNNNVSKTQEQPNTKIPELADGFKVGDMVKIKGTSNECQIIKIEGGNIWVDVNNKTAIYKPNEVEKIAVV